MTYCVGIMLEAGMVFASDSRTNAGVDQIASFRKMQVYERPEDRVIVITSSGNLSISQNTIGLIEQAARRNDGSPNIWNASSMFEVATLFGDCLRQVRERDSPYMKQTNVDSSANMIIGGQIRGEAQRMFMVYSEGNFIEAGTLMPFFQIGETKYGRPILDRVIKGDTTLTEAAKCTLVSFDSTMRSNISVGMPIDLVILPNNRLRVALQRRIVETDPYFSMLHQEWGEGLRRVFAQLPDPDWRLENG